MNYTPNKIYGSVDFHGAIYMAKAKKKATSYIAIDDITGKLGRMDHCNLNLIVADM